MASNIALLTLEISRLTDPSKVLNAYRYYTQSLKRPRLTEEKVREHGAAQLAAARKLSLGLQTITPDTITPEERERFKAVADIPGDVFAEYVETETPTIAGALLFWQKKQVT